MGKRYIIRCAVFDTDTALQFEKIAVRLCSTVYSFDQAVYQMLASK